MGVTAVARANGALGGRPKGGRSNKAPRRWLPGGENDAKLAMERNLVFWSRAVEDHAKQVRELIVDAESAEERAEAYKLLNKLLNARENMQSVAADLIQYQYPKYHSIAWQAPAADPEAGGAAAIPSDPVEAAITYQRLIRGEVA